MSWPRWSEPQSLVSYHLRELRTGELVTSHRSSADGRRSKHLDELSRRRFDFVITLWDRVREVCPEFPGQPEVIHWSIPDPGLEGDSDEATYPAFERTAGSLEDRIRFLLSVINTSSRRSHTHA